jgi:quaternary ammonium compound-resistance protein SugE
MSWLVLVLPGVLEAVWATALSRSQGFTRIVPSVTLGVSVVLSMAGLAYAMRDLPVGTAYVVWVGIGASLTVALRMFTDAEGPPTENPSMIVAEAEAVEAGTGAAPDGPGRPGRVPGSTGPEGP